MPTGFRLIRLVCFLCQGKGHFRKWFKHKECQVCKGKGDIEHYVSSIQFGGR